MDEKILSEESAETQVQSFLDFYELDRDAVPTSTRENFDTCVKKIISATRKGRLEFRDEGIVVQTLKRPPGQIKTITYSELSGKAKQAAGKFDSNDAFGRMYALLGSLSGLGAKAISNLKGVDVSLAECLGHVFMSV